MNYTPSQFFDMLRNVLHNFVEEREIRKEQVMARRFLSSKKFRQLQYDASMYRATEQAKKIRDHIQPDQDECFCSIDVSEVPSQVYSDFMEKLRTELLLRGLEPKTNVRTNGKAKILVSRMLPEERIDNDDPSTRLTF